MHWRKLTGDSGLLKDCRSNVNIFMSYFLVLYFFNVASMVLIKNEVIKTIFFIKTTKVLLPDYVFFDLYKWYASESVFNIGIETNALKVSLNIILTVSNENNRF